ncbi:MAG: ATP-dependent DNA helicase, partial [Alphaproteobacteria bacterium]|nr:ATP-dependent DNA helicase [Alphaproteobacteria bacterium]
VAGVALALPRFRGGKKVPPQLARMQAEDLVAAIFPDQLACAENLPGDREIPDHPLVRQAIADCLHEAMDIDGLERLLAGIESGAIRVVARDLTEPSPLALEVLSARPYAYLDDAPLEERRTQAVMSRRWLAPEAAADIGRLDPEAIARVREEAWPDAASADELADALSWLGFLAEREIAKPEWRDWLADLAIQRRVAKLPLPQAGEGRGEGIDPHRTVWISAERLPQFEALWPGTKPEPAIAAPAEYARAWSPEDALTDILRGRLEGLGPVSGQALAAPLGLEPGDVAAALVALETEGFVLRGRFTPSAAADEWCDRRLLARIHRYTVKRLRAEIEPVAPRDFLRFLFAWQRVAVDARMEGPESLPVVTAQLEGFEAAAAAWEPEILAQRIGDYEPAWLDDECLAGRIAWARLSPRNGRVNGGERGPTPVRSTPITLLARRHVPLWTSLSAAADAAPSPRSQAVLDAIRDHGASFFDELVDATGLLRTQVEEALAELVALGQVTSDSFAGLRALLVPSDQRKPFAGGRRRRRILAHGMDGAGRWALARRARASPTAPLGAEALEHVASVLLRRYGVVFWRLLEREAGWLPPWRDLLRVYRRLEARGDIRGGRFVAGFSGEQFALAEAVGKLREIRRQPDSGAWLSVSGADPLNLVGILTPGGKLPALASNRVLYQDGVPVAIFAGGDVRFLEKLEPGAQWQARKALLRGAVSLPRADPAQANADLNTRPVAKVV